MHRPEKLSHRQTVIYEFDMLEYCYQKLAGPSKKLTRYEQNVYIECFLLHYQNLIDFFGKEPTRDDLSICRPDDWRQNRQIDEQEQKNLCKDGKKVRNEYENLPAGDTISRYLQPCTQQRTEPKDWEENEMFNKLSPLIKGFRSLCQDQTHVVTDDPGLVVGNESTHTASIRDTNTGKERGYS